VPAKPERPLAWEGYCGLAPETCPSVSPGSSYATTAKAALLRLSGAMSY
jgi:hypothetical protein